MDKWRQLSEAYLEGDWPALIGNWIVISVFCSMIVVWGLVAGWRFWHGTRRLAAAFDKARVTLEATPSRSVDFAAQYEEANKTLHDAQVIGPAWRDWAATLLTPSVENRPVQSTIRPGEYFGLDLLRECGINPRLHAAMPNLLVGVGLLLTFVGLIVALMAAGEIASPSASATRRAVELQKLLNGASAKFATSLAGLLCSLLYTVWRGSRMQRAERAVHAFLAALEERVPLATSATLQAEANAILRDSQSQLEIFNQTLATSIGKAVDNALDTRLGDHIGPLREAIEGLVTTIGTQNQEALSQMLEDFLKRLDGGAKGELGAVAVSLQGTQAALGELQVGLTGAANGLVSAAGQIGAQAGTEVAAALARVSQQVDTLVDRLTDVDRQARSSSTATFEQAARGIAEAASGFRNAAGEMAGELRQAIAALVATSSLEAATANRKLSEQFAEMLDQLRAVGDAAREQGDIASREAAQRLDHAATALRGAADALKDAMGQGGSEAAGRLIGAVDEVRGALERIIGEAGAAMAGEGERAAQRQQEGVERLTTMLLDAVATLRKGAGDAALSLEEGGRKAGSSLEHGGATASSGINGASELLRQGAEAASRSLVAGGDVLMGQSRDAAARIGELRAAAETLRDAVLAMSEDARGAGEPLRAAAQHWEVMGKVAVNAVQQLEGTAQQASSAGQDVQAASARMQEAISAVQTLAQGLEVTTRGFGGVGDELDATLKALQAGLQGFANQISSYAKSTSDHMATGATELAATIEELKEILPDLIQQLRQTIADVKAGLR